MLHVFINRADFRPLSQIQAKSGRQIVACKLAYIFFYKSCRFSSVQSFSYIKYGRQIVHVAGKLALKEKFTCIVRQPFLRYHISRA